MLWLVSEAIDTPSLVTLSFLRLVSFRPKPVSRTLGRKPSGKEQHKKARPVRITRPKKGPVSDKVGQGQGKRVTERTERHCLSLSGSRMNTFYSHLLCTPHLGITGGVCLFFFFLALFRVRFFVGKLHRAEDAVVQDGQPAYALPPITPMRGEMGEKTAPIVV